jgi:hypothetical protein
MLMFLLGLPNQFTQWCEALTAKLAESASRSRLCSTAGRSEELLHTMIEHPSQRVFISQQQPSGSIGYSPRQMALRCCSRRSARLRRRTRRRTR